MKVVYVAGPYRGPSEWAVKCNIEAAERIAVALWQQGYAVICPHKNTAFFGGAAPDEVWLTGDLEIMRRCDLVVLVPGWRSSSGTRAEVAEAQRLSIPVYEWKEGELVKLTTDV